MFGIAVAALSSLSEEEKATYQKAYCGLCVALKRQFGQIARSTLSYDLTFLEILYNSLYEPVMDAGTSKCLSHPFKKVSYECSIFSAYCAQLSVAMAYHKCLDDVVDDSSLTGHLGSHALQGVYFKVRDKLPGHCLIVEESMNAIREIEHAHDASPDAASIVFGEMLAFCFECVPDYFPDIWSESLRSLGYWLGRFIYMMDAAVDISDDCKSGSYNPFLQMGLTENDSAFMRDVLSVLAGNAANAFEKLPIVDNVHLLRGILYQGVWQKFNIKFESKQRGRSKNGLNKQDKQDTV